MGLCMKLILYSLILASILSCMKAPSTQIDKGPEADCKDLDAALDKVSFGKIESIKAAR